ncbi:MAG: hypothetical protein HZA27_01155 [Candidatus Omnitrophica bacterium]|nr:hypothetical protein [Candidatus Omnitrophota bacterium]MBI5144775.1 hypothetical protein [Candidatus Omnitrophota bacterium]
MKNKKYKVIALLISLFIISCATVFKRQTFFSFLVPFLFAHCDTMDGPVIQAAKKALETRNVDSVLIWVQKDDEDEIRGVFEKTLEVRKLNPKAQELADMYFFETLVRIHRSGEGAPYTGIKPAGAEVEPGIEAADKAIEDATADNLVRGISIQIDNEIRQRFNNVMAKKKLIKQSVEAGREYVRAYIEFIHYIERLYSDISGDASHHTEIEETGHKQ